MSNLIIYPTKRLFKKGMYCFIKPYRMHQTLFYSILLSLLVFGAIDRTSANSNNLELDLRWKDGNVLPPNSTSVLDIMITNLSESSFTLVFVGVRFDWMQEGIYVYGDESEKTHELASKKSHTFSIIFNIPQNVRAGTHHVFVAVVYEINGVEVREVIQVDPPINVIEVVTVTFIETIVTTEFVNPEEGNTHVSRPSWLLPSIIIGGSLIVLLLFIHRRMRTKEKSAKIDRSSLKESHR